MPRAQTDPTIPTDQDAVLAREASRILDANAGDDAALRLRLCEGERGVAAASTRRIGSR